MRLDDEAVTKLGDADEDCRLHVLTVDDLGAFKRLRYEAENLMERMLEEPELGSVWMMELAQLNEALEEAGAVLKSEEQIHEHDTGIATSP